MAGWVEAMELWMAGAGAWAYLAAPAVMALVAVLPIPAEAPALVNGMLFGPVVGSALTWLGALAGAWLSFELARAFGRPLARRWIRPDALARVDEVARGAGWWGLLVARFVPVVAFTALNWGAGLLDVPRGRFLWTTAVGILPGAVVFTTSGVGLGRLWTASPELATGLALAAGALALVWAWQRRRRRPAEMGSG